MSTDQENEPVITFFKAYPYALPAMSADRTALGTIPAQAYQYCEAMTTASAFGWYAFPASDLQLWFDGVDIYIAHGDEWQRLSSEQLPDMDHWWNPHCPRHLHNMAPPFVTSLGIPGYVQVWSGLLVSTRKNWSILVRPIANVQKSKQLFCFEGIVETDQFGPAPLFINLKLQVTNTIIEIPAQDPLFQIQPIHRDCYARESLIASDHRSIAMDQPGAAGMNDIHWDGFQKTIRHADPAKDDHSAGQYATTTRKRARKAVTSLL